MSTKPLENFFENTKKYLENIAPRDIYILTRRFIDVNFQRQGYHGSSGFTKWKPVKNKKNGQAILVQHGQLIKSFYPQYRPFQVDIITDIPYAQQHNEGLSVSVSTYTRKKLRKASAIKPITRKNGSKKAVSISVYNAGDDVNVKAHKRQFMQRQFMPIQDNLADAPVLYNAIQKKLEAEIKKLFDNPF